MSVKTEADEQLDKAIDNIQRAIYNLQEIINNDCQGFDTIAADKYSVIYAAYPGEKVVLSGGRTITGWKKAAEGGQENRPELWTAQVPGVKEGEWYFHQLFVNGQRRQRARSASSTRARRASSRTSTCRSSLTVRWLAIAARRQ